MKIRTIVITAILVVGAGAATSYFVRRSHEANIVKVEVVPVTTVNNAAYSFGDTGTISILAICHKKRSHVYIHDFFFSYCSPHRRFRSSSRSSFFFWRPNS